MVVTVQCYLLCNQRRFILTLIRDLEKCVEDISNNKFWAITKQIFEFDNLCSIANERYQSGANSFNYERRYIFAKCYGLLKNNSNLDPTPVFFEILNRTNGDFHKTDLYIDIIEQQIEKFYFVGSIMRKTNKEDFQLYPIFLLYKVLLEIGKLTGEYKISDKEFYYWVATTRTYDGWKVTVESIIHSRKTGNLKSLDDVDTRYHRIIEILPQFDLGEGRGRPDYYALKNDYIDKIRGKVSLFEFIYNIKRNFKGAIPNGTTNIEDYEDLLTKNITLLPKLR